MPAQSGIKLIGAFFAGIVLALGAALIYARTSSMIRPQAVVAQRPVESQPQVSPPAVLPDADVSEKASTPELREEPLPQQSEPPAPVEKPRKANSAKPVQRVAKRDRTSTVRAAIPQLTATAVPPRPDVAREINPAPMPDPYLPASPATEVTPSASAAVEPRPTPAPRTPMTVTLEAGTVIPIRLSEKLSTEENYSGDTFRAVLDQPLILNGFIIADKGSKVLGRVIDVRRAGRLEGVADLTLALTEIHTTDGQNVRIHTNTLSRQGATSHQRDAAEIGGGAALGAIIGALAGGGKGAAIGAGAGGAAGTGVALGTRGKPAVVPVETHLTFKLQNSVTITEKLS